MTAEYMPAWIVAIADLLVMTLVVLSCRLSKAELKGVPRPLVTFVIGTSGMVATLLFLSVALGGYGLAKYHVDAPVPTLGYSPERTEKERTGPQNLRKGTNPLVEPLDG